MFRALDQTVLDCDRGEYEAPGGYGRPHPMGPQWGHPPGEEPAQVVAQVTIPLVKNKLRGM
eukprot:3441853-Pyramimonas_sp.AAC.1